MKPWFHAAAFIEQLFPFQMLPHLATLDSLKPLPPPSLLHSIIGTGIADLSMNNCMFFSLPSGNISTLMNCLNLCFCFFDKCDF